MSRSSLAQPRPYFPASRTILPQAIFRPRVQFPKKSLSTPASPSEMSPDPRFRQGMISPKAERHHTKALSGSAWKGESSGGGSTPAAAKVYGTHTMSSTRFLPDLPRLCGRSPTSLALFSPQVDTVIAKCCVKTRTGEVNGKSKKHNQDAYIMAQVCGAGSGLFAVLDGHGIHGHDVSGFIREHLGKEVAKAYFAAENEEEKQVTALRNGLKRVAEMVDRSRIDTSFSGSTCIAVSIHSHTLVCGNIGDSRALLLHHTNSVWDYIELSHDHKPDSPREKTRIVGLGGRVSPFRNESGRGIGPARVWIKGEEIPGLAMSRSIGDAVAHSVGVSYEPELLIRTLSPSDKAIIIASDGLWEFLTNEQVTYFAGKALDERDAEWCCQRLVEEALGRWRTEDDCIDDITVITVLLDVPTTDV